MNRGKRAGINGGSGRDPCSNPAIFYKNFVEKIASYRPVVFISKSNVNLDIISPMKASNSTGSGVSGDRGSQWGGGVEQGGGRKGRKDRRRRGVTGGLYFITGSYSRVIRGYFIACHNPIRRDRYIESGAIVIFYGSLWTTLLMAVIQRT